MRRLTEQNNMKQLECANRLLPGKKVLCDDALQRGDSATDKEKRNTKDCPIDITSAHEHRSDNHWNQRQVNAQGMDCTVNQELQSACKHWHCTSEHLRFRKEPLPT